MSRGSSATNVREEGREKGGWGMKKLRGKNENEKTASRPSSPDAVESREGRGKVTRIIQRPIYTSMRYDNAI